MTVMSTGNFKLLFESSISSSKSFDSLISFSICASPCSLTATYLNLKLPVVCILKEDAVLFIRLVLAAATLKAQTSSANSGTQLLMNNFLNRPVGSVLGDMEIFLTLSIKFVEHDDSP